MSFFKTDAFGKPVLENDPRKYIDRVAPLRIFIERRCIARGWTQLELSKHSGVPQGSIARMMNGIRKPYPDYLDKIGEALDMTEVEMSDMHRLGARAFGFKF